LKADIKSLRNNTAPGENHIDNRSVKLMPHRTLPKRLVEDEYHYAPWEASRYIRLLSPNKPAPAFGKFLDRCTLSRLLESQEVQNAIPKFQFGFRLRHGRPEQLHRVLNFLLQAFDRVWHEGLLRKLKSLLNTHLLLTIKARM